MIRQKMIFWEVLGVYSANYYNLKLNSGWKDKREGGCDWVITCTQEFRISELKIESASLNTTAIASGYACRDPQGGTSDGSFISKFSFKIQIMVKILLLVLIKKKRKIRLKWVRESGRMRRWRK